MDTKDGLGVFPEAEYKLVQFEKILHSVFEGLANTAHLLLDDPARSSRTSPGIEVTLTATVRRKDDEREFSWGSNSGGDQ